MQQAVKQFLEDSFEDALAALLDDPHGYANPYEIKCAYEQLEAVAEYLGRDMLAAKKKIGSAYELERLKGILGK